MQQIIVILIGVFVLAFICWKVYKTFTNKSAKENCSDCNSCALKEK